MAKYLVAICIPTYNRGRFLPHTLDSILGQIPTDMEELVQVVVSDNASDDGTQQFMTELVTRHPNVTYFRWSENQGADRNYLKVVELAQAEFCWFLGSDDRLAPGALSRVLDFLREGVTDILIFDRSEIYEGSQERRIGHWTGSAAGRCFNTSHEPRSLLRYLDECNSPGGVFSYLSVIVFRKRLWDCIPGAEKFVGTAYSHVYILLSMLRRGVNFRYLPEALVICTMGNDSFREGNSLLALYRRVKLDIDGYREIAFSVFGSDSEEASAIMGMLGRAHRLSGMLKLKMRMLASLQFQSQARSLDLLMKNSGFWGRYVVLSFVSLVQPLFAFLKHRE